MGSEMVASPMLEEALFSCRETSSPSWPLSPSSLGATMNQSLEEALEEESSGSDEETLADDNDNLLACLYLVNPGNRETIKLLMRGMPVPATYGFPNTDGGVWSNLREFCKQFHPSISIKFAHPLHPFSKKERLVVFLCTVAFNALWSAFTAYQRRRMTRAMSRRYQLAFYLFVKHFATVIYAVVIRQLVICPCAYNSLIRNMVTAPDPLNDRELQSRAKRLMTMKIVGDRVLLWLLVVHVGVVALVLVWMSTWTYTSGRASAVAYDSSPGAALQYIAISEVLNFFFWFVKFLPLFFVLYPIHRAKWFMGGTYADYCCCRPSVRGCCGCCRYATSDAYRDPAFPRSVQPETRRCASAKVRTLFTDVFYPRRSTGGYHLSTFRRDSEILCSLETETAPSSPVGESSPGFERAPSLRPRGRGIGGLFLFPGLASSSSGLDCLAASSSSSSSRRPNSSKTIPLRLASHLSSIVAPPLRKRCLTPTRDEQEAKTPLNRHLSSDFDSSSSSTRNPLGCAFATTRGGGTAADDPPPPSSSPAAEFLL